MQTKAYPGRLSSHAHVPVIALNGFFKKDDTAWD